MNNDQLIKKLQSLGIRVKTDRSISEWIKQGLGPLLFDMQKGRGHKTNTITKHLRSFMHLIND